MKVSARVLLALVIGFAIGVLVRQWNYPPKAVKLRPDQLAAILLYAEARDGFIVGKVFNQLPDIVLTDITIEARPADEKNPFNQGSPRYFNARLKAPPRSMSNKFRVETGALNPAFHTLHVTESKGYRAP